jgi:hypothetical protein
MHAALLTLLLALAPAAATVQFPPSAHLSGDVREQYAKLQAEFSAAAQEYQKALDALHANPNGTRPERPHKRFAARYAELGRAGHPLAARWCLDFIGDTSEDVAAQRELFLVCEEKLVPEVLWAESQQGKGNPPPVSYGPKELLRTIGSSSELLGREKALALCAELFDKLALPESKARALSAQATIELGGKPPDAAMPAAARELFTRVAKEFPETDSGKRSAGLLFRIENLAVGKTAPDFATQDVEGVAFKLSEYRGKVVVLDFWGFW